MLVSLGVVMCKLSWKRSAGSNWKKRRRQPQHFPCACKSSFLRQLPAFVEETGLNDSARRTRIDWHIDIHDGEVWQLGNLAGVVQIIVFAKGEAAVQNDVAFRI